MRHQNRQPVERAGMPAACRQRVPGKGAGRIFLDAEPRSYITPRLRATGTPATAAAWNQKDAFL